MYSYQLLMLVLIYKPLIVHHIQFKYTIINIMITIENNIASDIRLSRNVVKKESKRSRRFVRRCNTSSGDKN